MSFERFFNLTSYLVVGFGFLALWVSGTFGILISGGFLLALIGAFFAEGRRFQLPERLGTLLIFLVVPLFYFGWKFRLFGFSSNEAAIAGILARLILTLSVVKLFQRKSDRDWLFLYLMAFFEVLLGAALSISPLYLMSLIGYLFVAVLAIVLFDIRKSSRLVSANEERDVGLSAKTRLRKFPLVAGILLVSTVLLATPLFFLLPRVGGAGFGANQDGVSGLTGFSDRVSLGDIGRIQQSDAVVMRVRLDGDTDPNGLRWRGVALDSFDNRTWTRTRALPNEPFVRSENGTFRFDYATGRREVTIQTIYLEPLDTDVLFGLWRPVAIQGNFRILRKDGLGGVSADRNSFERTSYKVYSDRWSPSPETLRRDNAPYSDNLVSFLQVPDDLDGRIGALASEVTKDARSRYDRAVAVEQFLQTQFGYTLEQKATGAQPLADFLFNVREGHCEYFATAMVMMLRTQGVAARIVNGFQRGEYNETADLYVVRQRNAHSWVEVYFPRDGVWVPFDPTPAAGFVGGEADDGSLMMTLRGYIEALEAFWIQYFVAFDNQEQQSLFRSVKTGVVESQVKVSDWLSDLQASLRDWWANLRGEHGTETSIRAAATGVGILFGAILSAVVVVLVWRKLRNGKFLDWLRRLLAGRRRLTIVEFYEQMEKILAKSGIRRNPSQTPLEFSHATGIAEAVEITERYHRVRFGATKLSSSEQIEISRLLDAIRNELKRRRKSRT